MAACQLFVLPLGPKCTQSEIATLLSSLPNEEQERISNYKHWQDRQRTLLGSVLVRWMLHKFTDMQHLFMKRNDNGRPYIADNICWNGDFNLSHSGNWIVAALTHHGHIGVDVEKIGPLNEELLTYALSETELEMIHQQSPVNQVKTFFELWTTKEAIYKTGLVPDATPQPLDTMEWMDKLYTQSLYIDPDHPVTVCLDQKPPSMELTILDRSQLIECKPIR
ncbi:4'-phosphopantetheinyl transferase superfamily protein [Sporosarcina sp. ACRSM]|uniref:4'-phosphopantetheinyl transferase family protein n=1 Tax=Sporosarcina sp. ACRSM TaxID=2918216 RepID=UPI001EF4933C|nr:4'-phosphopantetheinyl transferase superfamily protein [Sporosarcina sp. ACRSM]MCG7334326.1 4'-phosphopantetheinyl transferase superfamily protein [Sporosarcina sp. ACRSM]